MQKTIQFLIFLALNFACLWLSSYLMDAGPDGEWYQQLSRAPWTPPDQVFALAWSFIMLCFAIYLTVLPNKSAKDYAGYAMILALCAGWNAVFFQWQQTAWALLILLTLTLLVLAVTVLNHRRQGAYSWLMLPFILWTLIASSLNAYPVFAA